MSEFNFWYDANQLLSRGSLISMVIGNRGGGKSYNAKKRIIKSYLKNGSQSVYIRRYRVELDRVKGTYFNDIRHEFPFMEFKVEGDIGYTRVAVAEGEEENQWNIVVYFMCLTQGNQAKSSSYPNVDFVVFDEYIVHSTNKNSGFLKNEVRILLDLIESIFRLRTPRVLLLSNAVSLVCPLFSYFDIQITPEHLNRVIENPKNRFFMFKDNAICVEFYTNSSYVEYKSKTPFGRLIEGTEYAEYSINNKPLEDNSAFIIPDKPAGKYKFLCSIKLNDFEFGCWYNMTEQLWYIDKNIDKSCPNKYCMIQNEQKAGYKYYKQIGSNNLDLLELRFASVTSTLYYQSQEIKTTMLNEILNKI